MVRFLSVPWLDPFLWSQFRVRGGRINNPNSRSKVTSKEGLQVWVVHAESRGLSLLSLLLAQKTVTRFIGFELKWPQKEKYLQKWLGKATLEKKLKAKTALPKSPANSKFKYQIRLFFFFFFLMFSQLVRGICWNLNLRLWIYLFLLSQFLLYRGESTYLSLKNAPFFI